MHLYGYLFYYISHLIQDHLGKNIRPIQPSLCILHKQCLSPEIDNRGSKWKEFPILIKYLVTLPSKYYQKPYFRLILCNNSSVLTIQWLNSNTKPIKNVNLAIKEGKRWPHPSSKPQSHMRLNEIYELQAACAILIYEKWAVKTSKEEKIVPTF